ncbi:MAG: hypothetical protein ACJAXL_001115 [Alphaproteobacteria bacterium]|jgi:hypothetical protein
MKLNNNAPCFGGCITKLFKGKQPLIIDNMPKPSELSISQHGVTQIDMRSNNQTQINNILNIIVQDALDSTKDFSFSRGGIILIDYNNGKPRISLKHGDNNSEVDKDIFLLESMRRQLSQYLKNIKNNTDINQSYKWVSNPTIQIGSVDTARIVHKDNGMNYLQQEFDFTFTYPIADCDISNPQSVKIKDSVPEGTFVMPNTVKNQPDLEAFDLFQKSEDIRGTVKIDPAPDNRYFTQIEKGCAGLWRTTTQANSEHDGESVLHYTPPHNKDRTVRIIALGRLNKKTYTPPLVRSKPIPIPQNKT